MISSLIDSGLSLIKVGKDKRPLGAWKEFQEHLNSKDEFVNYSGNVAMVCGKVSGGVEVIDIDVKYDRTGELYKNYKLAVAEQDIEILKKMVVQSTQNGGFHLIYRCSVVGGNTKLASRPPTYEEIKAGEKESVLIETRGEGGYVLVEPSEGYKIVYGKLTEIQTITPEEREILLDTARSFNQQAKVHNDRINPTDVTPLDAYAKDGDVLSLMESQGWTVIKDNGDKVFLRRPGDTKSKWSADFTRSKNVLYVWTTSSVFPDSGGYSPGAVYTYLLHNGDFSAAARDLLAKGYGSPKNDKYKEPPKVRVSLEDEDYTFLLGENEGIKKIHDIIDGNFEMGLKFGIPSLDNHLRFKLNQYLLIVANTNVGKTTVVLFLMVALIKENPELKFLLYTTENHVYSVKRLLMQFYLGKIILGINVNHSDIALANTWINEHFRFINPRSGFNYQELLLAGEKVMKTWPYHGLFIDPYNNLKVDLRIMPGANIYEYHVEASRCIGEFSKSVAGVILNCHTITGQQRMGGDSRPLLSHVESGGAFVNKCDDGVVLHRNIKDGTTYRISEIHVDKIKENLSGGVPTFNDQPVKLYLLFDQSKFVQENSMEHLGDKKISTFKSISTPTEEVPF